MGRLAGKVAFISGSGQGIGRATAVRFAQEGAKVIIAEIDQGAGRQSEALAKKTASDGGDALFISTDITDPESCKAAIAHGTEIFGSLTILHNNAGGSSLNDARVTEACEKEFWRVMKLNAFGTFLGCKYGIPELIKSGGGSVINMSSNMALMGMKGRDCYTASKGAVTAMTRSMAVEYAENKIRVNAIAPSVTTTDRLKTFLEKDPNIIAQSKLHLLGFIDPFEVAEMAVYLASDESRVVTGQVLSIDSGITIS